MGRFRGLDRCERAWISSDRVREVRHIFGLVGDETEADEVHLPEMVTVQPGELGVVTGPSGSGKTTFLQAMQHHDLQTVMFLPDQFPPGCAIIDGVRANESLEKGMRLLGACGLGEPRLWLRSYDTLSRGEQLRASLARQMGRVFQSGGQTMLLIDEFGSGLHRRCAGAMAFNLRQLVTRYRLRLLVTLHDDDLLPVLQPDWLIQTGKPFRVSRPPVQPMSFAERMGLVVVSGSKRDYASFASMHYRGGKSPGFTDKVFVLREPGETGGILGIVVYCYGPLELTLRNQATDNRFKGKPKSLNRNVRNLQRLVIHPDVRGCGLGRYLVEQTLPRVGTSYVECLSAMGDMVPVFEQAGMDRIGKCAMPARQQRALQKLKALNVDPEQADFEQVVCQSRTIRSIVYETLHRWYALRTPMARKRVDRLSPNTMAILFQTLMHSRPVYYLWQRDVQVRSQAA